MAWAPLGWTGGGRRVLSRRTGPLWPSADVGPGKITGRGTQQGTTRDRGGGDVRLGGWRVSCGRAPSGGEWNRSQPCQGATELGFPRPALWQMQGEAACRAGEPSGQGEEPSPKGLGCRDLLAQTDPRRPAGQQLCWLSRMIGSFCGTRTTPWRAMFDHGV